MSSGGTLSSAQLLHVLQAHAKGKFQVNIDCANLCGDDLELALWLNDYATRQCIADQSIQQILGQVGGAPTEINDTHWERRSKQMVRAIKCVHQPLEQCIRIMDAVSTGNFTTTYSAIPITVDPELDQSIAATTTRMLRTLSLFSLSLSTIISGINSGKFVIGENNIVQQFSGMWRDLFIAVNNMTANLGSQIRAIADVTTAIASGDLSKKVVVNAEGEILDLKVTINTMVDQFYMFASEVTRVIHEVGTQGCLGGQAMIRGVRGVWKDIVDNINTMTAKFTTEVRAITAVATSVALCDFSRKMTRDVRGEVLELRSTINTMVDMIACTTSHAEHWTKALLEPKQQLPLMNDDDDDDDRARTVRHNRQLIENMNVIAERAHFAQVFFLVARESLNCHSLWSRLPKDVIRMILHLLCGSGPRGKYLYSLGNFILQHIKSIKVLIAERKRGYHWLCLL